MRLVTCWERDDRVLWRWGPGFVLLLGPLASLPAALRGTGVALWAALDRPLTFGDLAADLARRYRADRDLVAADLEPVLADLVDMEVVRRAA